MYLRFRRLYSLSELAGSIPDVAALRRQLKIAIIDDQPFEQAATLAGSYGFHVVELGDIHDLHAVSEYDIIACDIHDVGRHFKSQYGGANLIYEIRKKYPDKYIIAYSGGGYSPDYQRFIGKSDVSLKKGAPIEDWVETLETGSRLVGDPIQRWKRVRLLLLERGVPTFQVFLIEDAYIRSIKDKNEFVLQKALDKAQLERETQRTVAQFGQSLMSFVKLYLEIAGG